MIVELPQRGIMHLTLNRVGLLNGIAIEQSLRDSKPRFRPVLKLILNNFHKLYTLFFLL